MEESYYHEYADADERHWWFAGRQMIIRELVRQWLPSGSKRTILDVGCGTGGMLKLLAEFGDVHGLEPSADAIGYCRARVGALATLHQGVVPDGMPSGIAFDLITAFDVLEHLEDPVVVLKHLRGALAPGAVFICTVPAFSFLWSEHDEINHHHRRYTRASLRKDLESAGFEVRYSSYFNTLLFLPIALVRLLERLLPHRNKAKSDVGMPSALVNSGLRSLFGAERYLMRFTSLPAGVSLAAVAIVSND